MVTMTAQERIDRTIRKLELWIDNLETNAANYEHRGYGHLARAPRTRAQDFRDVIELLKGR